MTAPLPRPAQLAAQRRFLLVGALNPLGANLTIGPVCTLLALHYGASDLQMGLLYAGVYLAGLCAVAAPALFAGRDASRVTAASWWTRSLLALGLLALPLAAPGAKSWLLIALFYAFMAIRAVGVATMPSMLRAITGRRELATVNAGSHLRWHLGCLATSLLAWAVLSQRAALGDETAFMLLLGVGAAFNLATSWVLSGMPDTGLIERGSWRALAEGAALSWRHRPYREVLYATALQVPMAVASAYQINHLSVELGFSPATITGLTVAGIVVAVAGARALVLIGSRIPVRPLLVGSHIGLALLGAGWTWLSLLPPDLRPGAGAALFVASTLFLATSGVLLAALSSERLPERGAVSVSVMYQLAGVAAALAGLGAVQLLAAAAPWADWPGMHRYSHAFLLWTVLSLGVCALGLAMADGRLSALADDFDQLRPSNLLTVFRAHSVQVRAVSAPGQVRELEDVLATPVPATAELLLDALRSPEARSRAAAYRALYQRPLERAVPLVAAEAACADSPLRNEAVTALGFIHVPAAAAELRRLAGDPDPGVSAAAWKGLLRHGEPIDRAALAERYRTCALSRHRLDLVFGLLDRQRPDLLLDALAHELAAGTGPVFLRTVLVVLAESLGDPQRMAELLAREAQDPAGALDELLAELPETLAGAGREAWRAALRADGTVAMPPGARLPGGLAPAGATALIGLLHCARLESAAPAAT